MTEQILSRRGASVRYAALCFCCALVFMALIDAVGYHPLLLFPFSLAAVLGVPYFSASYTYRYDSRGLSIYRGCGEGASLMECIRPEDILAYGVYLPRQLSSRRAQRKVRAYLFLDPRSKRYLLYRLDGGGTGILIFSPGRVLMESLRCERWLFQNAN